VKTTSVVEARSLDGGVEAMLRRSTHFALAAAILAQIAVALPVVAGGLYIAEFATSDMGAAGSGALARGGDAASAFLNPSTMTRLDSHQLNLGMAPGASIVRFDQDSDSLSAADNNGGDQGGFIPLLGSSYVHKISDRWRAGLAIFSISGASLQPNNDWAGRNQVTKIQLFTLSFVPTVAVRLTDWLSVGGGPTITYATLDWKLKLPVAGGEGDLKLDGLDDWQVSGLVGVLLEPSDRFRLGFVYQSKTDFTLSGNAKGPLGTNPESKLDLPLPHAFRADAIWQATDQLALSFGGAFENWSDLSDTDLTLGAVESNVHLGFKDTWKLRGGIHYRLDERWMLQTGLSYDSSALNTSDRTAALPIDEQWRWGIGAVYEWSDSTTIGFGFQYVNLGDGNINTNDPGPPATGFKGKYKDNEILFFMLNLNFAKLPWDGMASF
jgi:long-chain fatty acid transport protein